MDEMSRSDLRLRPVRVDDEQAVRAAQAAMAPEGFVFAHGLTPETSWSAYCQKLADSVANRNVRADWVPATFLLAEVAGTLVGRVSVRHLLNDMLIAHARSSPPP